MSFGRQHSVVRGRRKLAPIFMKAGEKPCRNAVYAHTAKGTQRGRKTDPEKKSKGCTDSVGAANSA